MAVYRIVVKGSLGSSLVGPLEGMVVEKVETESSLLIDVVDQSHMYGVLHALADRGFEIVRIDVASEGASERTSARRPPGGSASERRPAQER